MSDEVEERGESPAHYPTIRGSLRTLGGQYLKSLDATVRLLGAWVIWAVLFGCVWAGLLGLGYFWAIIHDLTGGALPDTLGWWLGAAVLSLLGPPIIRVGLLGAGFEIPSLFRKGR